MNGNPLSKVFIMNLELRCSSAVRNKRPIFLPFFSRCKNTSSFTFSLLVQTEPDGNLQQLSICLLTKSQNAITKGKKNEGGESILVT